MDTAMNTLQPKEMIRSMTADQWNEMRNEMRRAGALERPDLSRCSLKGLDLSDFYS
jgi:hypothetical protein